MKQIALCQGNIRKAHPGHLVHIRADSHEPGVKFTEIIITYGEKIDRNTHQEHHSEYDTHRNPLSYVVYFEYI